MSMCVEEDTVVDFNQNPVFTLPHERGGIVALDGEAYYEYVRGGRYGC